MNNRWMLPLLVALMGVLTAPAFGAGKCRRTYFFDYALKNPRNPRGDLRARARELFELECRGKPALLRVSEFRLSPVQPWVVSRKSVRVRGLVTLQR
jgi:hypothetical protein